MMQQIREICMENNACRRFIDDLTAFPKRTEKEMEKEMEKEININLSQYSECKCLSEMLDTIIREYKKRGYSITLGGVELQNIDIIPLESWDREKIELKIKAGLCLDVYDKSNKYYISYYIIIKTDNMGTIKKKIDDEIANKIEGEIRYCNDLEDENLEELSLYIQEQKQEKKLNIVYKAIKKKYE